MNDRCRLKDCIYRKVCMCHFDLNDCSRYTNTGILDPSITGVGPMDKQKDLFPRNQL